MRIAISTSTFAVADPKPLMLCRQHGLDIALNPHGRTLSREEILSLATDCVGLVAGTETLDSSVLEQLPDLRVISRCGTGLDNVDLAAASRLGKVVFNTPDAATTAVAELTIGLILSLLRRISAANQDVHGKRWVKRSGNLLHGKRVGIVGFGRIGQEVGRLLNAFGVEIGYYDPQRKAPPFNATAMTLEKALGWADILTLHLPGRGGSEQALLGDAEFQKMRRGVWVINTSRGEHIDEAALRRAIEKGHVQGAALDVFAREPYTGPLIELGQVLLTPHIGSQASEARIIMETEAVSNLLKGLGLATKVPA